MSFFGLAGYSNCFSVFIVGERGFTPRDNAHIIRTTAAKLSIVLQLSEWIQDRLSVLNAHGVVAVRVGVRCR